MDDLDTSPLWNGDGAGGDGDLDLVLVVGGVVLLAIVVMLVMNTSTGQSAPDSGSEPQGEEDIELDDVTEELPGGLIE